MSERMEELVAHSRSRRHTTAEVYKVDGLIDWLRDTFRDLADNPAKYRGITFMDVYSLAVDKFDYPKSHQSLRQTLARCEPELWENWKAFHRGA